MGGAIHDFVSIVSRFARAVVPGTDRLTCGFGQSENVS